MINPGGERIQAAVFGAGPAGLTAAHELAGWDFEVLIFEKTGKIGGTARTEVHDGYKFDIGGHRFFTKVERIEALWKGILGDDLIEVERRSHIYYQGKFYKYPFELFNALANLGLIESIRVLLSYGEARLKPRREVNTFEDWIINHFGQRLYRMFFKTYTEKVWGIPCSEIHAEWAAQRIRGLSLVTAVSSALFNTNNVKSLTRRFLYPRLGPGMMWESFREVIEKKGGRVFLEAPLIRLLKEGNRIQRAIVSLKGKEVEVTSDHYLTTLALDELIGCFDPPPPPEVLEASRQLQYRSFLLVGLVVDRPDLFQDQWIYVHDPEIRAGRIQNFGNWSADMVPDPGKTSLGVEYFCNDGDHIWKMEDEELIDLAARETARLELVGVDEIMGGVVFRQPKAYPVYQEGYETHISMIKSYLDTIDNLQSVGRNGTHRYNNMDHSMLTALLAAENILGAGHDYWEVNRRGEYHEEIEKTA